MDGALEMLERVTENLQPWWQVITLTCYFVGFGLIIAGVVMFASQKRGMMRQGLEMKTPMMAIVAGLLMMNLFAFLDVISASTLGGEAAKALEYEKASGASTQQYVMLKFAVYVTMLVGFASLVKGIYGLYSSSHDPRGFWPSVTHILGGFFAMNIEQFMIVLGKTTGGPVETTIRNLVTG
jgi:hypothetical protein